MDKKSFGWLGYEWFDFTDFTIKPQLREGAAIMEFGTRSYTTNVAFRESLKLLNHFGIEKIHNHNQSLKEMFINGIEEKGYTLFNRQAGAPIVSFKPPRSDPQKLKLALWDNNFRIALRDDFIRASFHLVNDREEVQALLDFL